MSANPTPRHFLDCPKRRDLYTTDWCDCGQRIAAGETPEPETPAATEITVTLAPNEAEFVIRAVRHYKDALELAHVEAPVQGAGQIDWNILCGVGIDLLRRIEEAGRAAG